MAKNCPKCNFLNPYGAQICGECGHPLILPKIVPQAKKPDHVSITSRIRWKSIGIEKVNKEASPPLIIVLTLCLFTYGLILLMVSLGSWFKPSYGLSFITLPNHLYPLLLGIFLGSFTIILAFGIYLRKWWVMIRYFVWVGIQILLMLLLSVGWWKPEWFTIKVRGIFSVIILIELFIIPLVLRFKGQSVKH